MKGVLTKALLVLILVSATTMIILRFWLLLHIDAHENAVLVPGPYAASEQSRTLHKDASIVDLHADSLLWRV